MDRIEVREFEALSASFVCTTHLGEARNTPAQTHC
jgi:hypothetical protein